MPLGPSANPLGAATLPKSPVGQTAAPKLKKVKKKPKDSDEESVASMLLGMAAIVAALVFVPPLLMYLSGFGEFIFILGNLYVIVGALAFGICNLWLISVAFSEDASSGFLCFFVPFYNVYYLFTRWPETSGPGLGFGFGTALFLGGLINVAIGVTTMPRGGSAIPYSQTVVTSPSHSQPYSQPLPTPSAAQGQPFSPPVVFTPSNHDDPSQVSPNDPTRPQLNRPRGTDDVVGIMPNPNGSNPILRPTTPPNMPVEPPVQQPGPPQTEPLVTDNADPRANVPWTTASQLCGTKGYLKESLTFFHGAMLIDDTLLTERMRWNDTLLRATPGMHWGLAVQYSGTNPLGPNHTKSYAFNPHFLPMEMRREIAREVEALTGPLGKKLLETIDAFSLRRSNGSWVPSLAGEDTAMNDLIRFAEVYDLAEEQDSLAQAREDQVELLLVAHLARGNSDRTMSIRLVDAADGKAYFTSPVISGKLYQEYFDQGQMGEDPSKVPLDQVLAALHGQFRLSPDAQPSAEKVFARAALLKSRTTEPPLRLLAELRFYLLLQLLTPDQAIEAASPTVGAEVARTVLTSPPAARRAAIVRWIPQIPEMIHVP